MSVRNSRARVPLALGVDGTSLPGAACTGEAPKFDGYIYKETAEDREQRQGEAREVCQTCPVRAGCLARLIELQHGPELVEGVWAGEVLIPAASGVPCRVCGTTLPRARRRNTTCSKECTAVARTRRARTETCLVCDAPILGERLRLNAVTCTLRCSRHHELNRQRQIREEYAAAEVQWVLAGGAPDIGAPDIGAPARARLVAHWTAEGHDQEWIARRLRIGVRQVRRDLTGGSR